MCGIVGVAAKTPVNDRRWLGYAADAMRHRGPDDAGEWWSSDGRVGLGHRRLSILDLSPAGHQPMRSADGDLCIAFNGEIYNFDDLRKELQASGVTFRSRSDTEVILASYRAWGPECVERLHGMFAFALYDRVRAQLFLARDRAGEKPLFYTIDNGTLRFASELKGLMACPTQVRRVDAESLDCYLAMGFVPGERSILEGVKKLPPAHALLYDLSTGSVREWRFWKMPPFNGNGSGAAVSEAALLDELESVLEDSVHRQMVADVPVGILLSGGVDSSLVTALAARSATGLRTFTIRFPGSSSHDETPHARLIAEHFGTNHLELEAEATTVDLLPTLARQFDEPLIDSSMLPTFLVSRMIRSHCKVALGGDGGDELFGGYSVYDRMLRMHRVVRHIPRVFQRGMAQAAGVFMPMGVKGRNWLQAMQTDWHHDVPQIASYFDLRARRKLLGREPAWQRVAEHVYQDHTPHDSDLLQRSTRMDFENYLPEDILVKVDRASMLNSLEVRAPLLGARVIEFAFRRIPSHLKASTEGRKILLKKLAARLLPAAFDMRRKQGFSIPLDSWLRTPTWQHYFRDVLLGGRQTVFDHNLIRSLLAGQQRGRNNGERLFGLVMFELWRHEYQVQI